MYVVKGWFIIPDVLSLKPWNKMCGGQFINFEPEPKILLQISWVVILVWYVVWASDGKFLILVGSGAGCCWHRGTDKVYILLKSN